MVTVDCGITAVDEVARARELGLDIVVTDHHRPGEQLPDCPLVVTRPSTYPFPELCGTGVVYKLAQALVGDEALREHLDLVALATVADVVPLVDENRGLVAAGLRRLARTTKPGLVALMRSAGVDPATVDSGNIGFRLAPRINAAGRLGHPGSALRLLLTDDSDEAAQLAGELETLNRDRQAVEDRILRDALRQIEAWPEATTSPAGLCRLGRGLAPGCHRDRRLAARRAVQPPRRHDRRRATASGRVRAARFRPSTCMPRWPRAAPCWSASAAIAPRPGSRSGPRTSRPSPKRSPNTPGRSSADEELRPVVRVDAVVRGERADARPLRGARAARAVRARQPRGHPAGPGVRARRARGRRRREAPAAVAVIADGVRSGAIAFGQGALLDRFRAPGRRDVAFRLGANRWNGTVSPAARRQADLRDSPGTTRQLRTRLAAEWRAGEESWSAEARTIFVELGLLDGPGSKRHLVESEAFRALLAGAPAELERAA